MKRLLSEVRPTDTLHCSLGNHKAPASEFVTRGPNKGESHRSPSYRAYCKHCHRTRGRSPAQWAVTLKSAGHKRPQRRFNTDPRIEEARKLRSKAARLEREACKGREGYVYLAIEVNVGGGLEFGKVGHTTDLDRRIATLQQGNPRHLRMMYAKPGTEDDEKALHQKYISNNKLGEWFRITKELLLEWGNEHYVYEHPDAA